jgi:hypothetical protein
VNTKQPLSRRKFLGVALAGVPVVVAMDRLSAQEARQLTPEDPRYGALGYYPNTADVDPAKEPLFQAGRNCANCSQIKGNEGDALRPCALFPDLQDPSQSLLVAAEGWCRSWIAMS